MGSTRLAQPAAGSKGLTKTTGDFIVLEETAQKVVMNFNNTVSNRTGNDFWLFN